MEDRKKKIAALEALLDIYRLDRIKIEQELGMTPTGPGLTRSYAHLIQALEDLGDPRDAQKKMSVEEYQKFYSENLDRLVEANERDLEVDRIVKDLAQKPPSGKN